MFDTEMHNRLGFTHFEHLAMSALSEADARTLPVKELGSLPRPRSISNSRATMGWTRCAPNGSRDSPPPPGNFSTSPTPTTRPGHQNPACLTDWQGNVGPLDRPNSACRSGTRGLPSTTFGAGPDGNGSISDHSSA
ncbi:hypothetical protein ABZ517_19560 [Streptomyces scabiei]|uniref:hypothetical protein n=1 Tax=Streptomyces scabiei TaxID=1930 RepID=UPI0033CCBD69